jgi:hypothetical protein
MPQFKLGRNRPPAGRKKLHLRNYMLAELPAPPPSCSYVPRAAGALKQVYLNDQLGDCVIACMAHLVGVFTGNAGLPAAQFTPAQITALYSAIGGYVPGDDSTDQGCDEQTALAYWQANGAPVGANKIAAWVAVDGTKPAQYRAAMWLFENLVFGVELPDQWITPFPSAPSFVWDVSGPANPDNGHCFCGVGYTSHGVVIDTWGMTGTITDRAIQTYAAAPNGGEMYAVLTPEIIARATTKAPNGYNWAQLQADFAAL